jgi:hypothetical protein
VAKSLAEVVASCAAFHTTLAPRGIELIAYEVHEKTPARKLLSHFRLILSRPIPDRKEANLSS